MEIGHRIKKARMAAGLSQDGLASAAKVSRGLVGQWESHRKKPGRDNLLKIADATAVSVAYLLGQEDFDSVTLSTRNQGEVSLLRHYRRLNPVQQKNVLHLVGISADIRQEIEQQRHPAERESVP